MAEDTHTPTEGDQYRNKVTIPGYGPGLLLIEIIEVIGNKVSFVVIESNRLRTGPFVGVEGALPLDQLNVSFEYLEPTDPSEGELELEPTA